MSTLVTRAQPPLSPPPCAVVIAGHRLGDGTFAVIAGPCSLVALEPALRVADAVRAAGATMFRGGAFKPRSNPGAFQGLGRRGLEILLEVKRATGLAIVTEVLDPRDVEPTLAVADVMQVGARNMHNTALLKELGRVDCAVLIKRGLAATIDETVSAADYVRDGGNERIVLCERGIRTFETAYRFTLDLLAVPILKERSGLPVIVDPSHAAGRRDLVPAMSLAAAAGGADGLIVEVDENPDLALSDAAQQLHCEGFAACMRGVGTIASAVGREMLRSA